MSDIDVQRPSSSITVVTLNRPEKLNALSFDLVEEFHAALDEISADNSAARRRPHRRRARLLFGARSHGDRTLSGRRRHQRTAFGNAIPRTDR